MENYVDGLKSIEGKTIEKVSTVGEKSMINYIIDIKFTDGTSRCFLNAHDYQCNVDFEVKNLFLKLWDKAGTSDYDKSEWKKLESLLDSRGIRLY